MTEQELVYGLRNGDEFAFKELVLQFQDRVFNTSLGLLQHSMDAEDIAPGSFYTGLPLSTQFKEESKLSTWIYKITTTKCLDHLRSKKRKKRFGIVSSLFGIDNTPIHEPGEFNHPGVQFDRKEDAAQLFKLVQELPESQRTAFILNKVEELSYRDIAAIMNTQNRPWIRFYRGPNKILEKK